MQSVIQAPQSAFINLAIYSFFLLQMQVWVNKKFTSDTTKWVIWVTYLGLYLAIIGLTVSNLYVYYVDQPILIGQNLESIASQEFHAGLRVLWQWLSILPLVIDSVSLVVLMLTFRTRPKLVSILTFLLVGLDVVVVYVYFTLKIG